MNLRPTYVFDTMQSKGINGINTGRMILVGESLENNTGIFIVDKNTAALTANTTIQQALDGGYLKMLRKKTTEKFGEYQFDNISNSNPVMSSGLTLGKTWLNQTTGEVFITATVNGVTGWKGNKGTTIAKDVMVEKSGFLSLNTNLPISDSIQNDTYRVDLKEFDICANEWWELGNFTKLRAGKSIIVPRGQLKIDDMWVACDYTAPFPKINVDEEENLANERKRISGSYPCRKITNVQPFTYYKQPQIDFLMNWTFGPFGTTDKDYVGNVPLPTKPETQPNDDGTKIDCVNVVFQIMKGDTFQHNGVLGNGGDNVSFSAKKGVYHEHDNFLAPGYKNGISKKCVEWLKQNEGKIVYIHNILRHGNQNDSVSKTDFWNNFVY